MDPLPPTAAKTSRRRKWLWRLILYTPLAAILLVVLLHPYPRQALFGPKINGEPVWYWKERFRYRANRAAYDGSLFNRMAALVGFRSVVDETLPIPLSDPAMLPVLVELLEDDDWQVRREVTLAITWQNPLPDAAAPLARRLDDAAPVVRAAAAHGVGRYGPRAEAALPRLRQMLADEPAECRVAAAHAVWSVGKEPAAALPVLRGALQDTDPRVRRAALFALLEMGEAAAPAFPDVIAAGTADPDANVRHAAALCLEGAGPKGIAALRTMTGDFDRNVRVWAAHCLGRLGPPARAAVPELRRLLPDADSNVRDAAARALSRIDPEQFPPPREDGLEP